MIRLPWRRPRPCPPEEPRPAAPDPRAAGRAEAWARIDALIQRTTREA